MHCLSIPLDRLRKTMKIIYLEYFLGCLSPRDHFPSGEKKERGREIWR
jgi:hypothetical protein